MVRSKNFAALDCRILCTEHLICIRHAFYLIAGKMLRSRAALAGFQDSMSVSIRFKCL